MRDIRLPENLNPNRLSASDTTSAASKQVLAPQSVSATYVRNYVCAPRLLRTKEAALYLGMSQWKIKRLIHDGKLRVVADGDRSPWLVDRRDLDAYIESNLRTY